MEEKFKIKKEKCDICGKTIKKVLRLEDNEDMATNCIQYAKNGKTYNICTTCEQKYRITDGFERRGYGYRGDCRPKRTRLDKSLTPTYGIEMEVGGNISNIDKISKLAQNEVTIGYDSSVEGAMYEFSYCPGTYYWYLYESNLRGVCALLSKDKWVNKESSTTGMHIHVGTIPIKEKLYSIIIESQRNELFWLMMRIFGERVLNQYCEPQFLHGHHDAISWSSRWGTLEFRIFRMEYNFDKIMARIRFIRQIIDNCTEFGIDWQNFRQESKNFYMELLQKARCIDREGKEAIRKLFETELEKKTPELNEDAKYAISRLKEESDNYWNLAENDEDEEEEVEEYF